jgi:hypothetical protein
LPLRQGRAFPVCDQCVERWLPRRIDQGAAQSAETSELKKSDRSHIAAMDRWVAARQSVKNRVRSSDELAKKDLG